MRKNTIKRCIDCHFLAKKIQRHGFSQIETVTESDRQSMLKNECDLKDVESFHCFQKVWDERTDPGIKHNREYIIAEKNRDGQCFYLEHNPDLSFEAAQQQRKRKAEVPRIESFVLLGERSWLIWVISALILLASILYVKY